MSQNHQLFINGEWVPALAGETFESINPYNQEVVGVYARARAADVDRAVKAARQAFDEGPWPRMTAEERAVTSKPCRRRSANRAKL